MDNPISLGQSLTKVLIQDTLKSRDLLENYRPDWLFGMELDFFIPSLNVAIEFQGGQHYYPVFGVESFLAQEQRDKRKKDICFKRGIILVALDASSMNQNGLLSGINTQLCLFYPGKSKRFRKDMIKELVWFYYKKQEQKSLASQRYYCSIIRDNFKCPTALSAGREKRMGLFRAKKRGLRGLRPIKFIRKEQK